MGHNNSLGNIANIVVCALSMVFVGVLVWVTNKRKAAVGELLLVFFSPIELGRLVFRRSAVAFIVGEMSSS